ncbi:hypothetical protein [Burkholderia multivorans]|uniref:hypothetical protein n=1 Tax=Burkholderia multivorans TaxID=87883 RepID=UPI000B921976|nr:hypothetical protein [Burkholderia multivorans]MBJ9655355.1 hypothetical protein [Burkholderia multivorans]MBR8240652.1 hypothetical protein [Burkholderia multivorans]MBU9457299.1 hypothetical protein [Burkholderia multivorans]OXH91802.1 hypothetical protein CA831_05260 [Burkholderia multivorans]OXH93231.1 hypothetical protein CA830_08845 [Burkholderia multivorans]
MGAFEEFANQQGVASLPPVPVMTREAFAAAIGLPVTVLVAQCDRGYWPTMKIGKYSFINVELVRKSALAREFAV